MEFVWTNLRELAYRIDPVLWGHDILDVTPAPWQETSGARGRNSWRHRVFIDRETVERTADRGRSVD